MLRTILAGSVVPLVVIGSHFMYCKATESIAVITIQNKYEHVRQGNTSYYVVDERGAHYSLSPSIWYGSYAANEVYISIELGEKYSVKFIGRKSNFFGSYPDIVTLEKIKDVETTHKKEEKIPSTEITSSSQTTNINTKIQDEHRNTKLLELNNRMTSIENSLANLHIRLDNVAHYQNQPWLQTDRDSS
eukprot:Phypoly_transcript_20598.p1 GENE.Phypoly_transcript_20598~~Phypoly_transcript_20598.p1  ORF type:complete len:189 (+),score=21.63 Phypoly_transcript_20598:63-629(+)